MEKAAVHRSMRPPSTYSLCTRGQPTPQHGTRPRRGGQKSTKERQPKTSTCLPPCPNFLPPAVPGKGQADPAPRFCASGAESCAPNGAHESRLMCGSRATLTHCPPRRVKKEKGKAPPPLRRSRRRTQSTYLTATGTWKLPRALSGQNHCAAPVCPSGPY